MRQYNQRINNNGKEIIENKQALKNPGRTRNPLNPVGRPKKNA
jgi:hypothetical protein